MADLKQGLPLGTKVSRIQGVSGIRVWEYEAAAQRTISPECRADLNKALLNAVLGLVGEAGEVADHLKKHLFHGHDIDFSHIAKELGDIMWYVAEACFASGYSMAEVADMNIEKLLKRYPDGFSSERSLNRLDLVEVPAVEDTLRAGIPRAQNPVIMLIPEAGVEDNIPKCKNCGYALDQHTRQEGYCLHGGNGEDATTYEPESKITVRAAVLMDSRAEDLTGFDEVDDEEDTRDRSPLHYFNGDLSKEEYPTGHTTPGWYFWDEVWANAIGPYGHRALAVHALENYCKALDAKPPAQETNCAEPDCKITGSHTHGRVQEQVFANSGDPTFSRPTDPTYEPSSDPELSRPTDEQYSGLRNPNPRVPQCGTRRENSGTQGVLICTRPKGHAGNHQAWDKEPVAWYDRRDGGFMGVIKL